RSPQSRGAQVKWRAALGCELRVLNVELDQGFDMLRDEGDRRHDDAAEIARRGDDFRFRRRAQPLQRADAGLVADAGIPRWGQGAFYGGDALLDLPLIGIARRYDALGQAVGGEKHARVRRRSGG